MKFLKRIVETYNKGLLYDSLLSERDALVKEMERLDDEIVGLQITHYKEIDELNRRILVLERQLREKQESLLKDYWYNKYPKVTNKKWNGVWLKDYCSKKNFHVPIISGVSNDDKANKALVKVYNYMKYTSDEKEYWQFADETVDRKLGDCEDGAILMYNIMVASGIPVWRIRLNAGNVQGGGHAWVTYLREKDNQWYILDWCYWYKESINFRKTWKEAEKYFSIWFSWNNDYVWDDENQGRE